MLLSTTTLRFLPLHTPSPPATPQIHLRRSPTLITFPFPTLPRRTRISHAPAFSDDRPPEAADVSDSGDGVRVSVARIGINKRRVQASVGIGAALDVVWAVITDYEGLAEFIPSLSVCRLLERSGSFVKIYQVGQQDLGLGLKFNAKGVLDCYEKGVEEVGDCRRREIDFKMVEGDFQTFEGTWSMIEDDSKKHCEEIFGNQDFLCVLSYVVDIEPKYLLPVRLIEGRICSEVRNNLTCIREESQRIQEASQSTIR